MHESLPDAAICIPTLNEGASIAGLLARVCTIMEGNRYTICLVDDGSTDGTVEAIKAAAASNPRIHLIEGRRVGRGCQRGLASRRGLEWLLAHTDHAAVVDLDADGSQRPEELPIGLTRLTESGVDVVVASKYLDGARVLKRSWLRRTASRVYSLFLRALIRPDISDYSNSYRFYSRRAAELVLAFPLRYHSPVHLLEMMAIWLANGMTVTEFPTLYGPRRYGTSKMSPLDFVKGALAVLDVAWRFRTGQYRAPNSTNQMHH